MGILAIAMLALLIVVVICVGIAVFAVALTRRSKAQLAANLEAPGMPAGAPVEWAGAHTPEARLHRRLLGLARTLAAVPLGDAAAIERRVAVEQHIRDLDGRLIALAVVPEPARREQVLALEPEAAAVEAEVSAVATEPPLGP